MPETWAWIERVSWLATLVGLPFVLIPVYFLWREQRRVRLELTRHPAIQFGFLPDSGGEPPRPLPTELMISPHWTPGHDVSELLPLLLAARNVGKRTARDLVFNVWVPPPPGQPASENREEIPVPPLNPGAIQPFTKKVSFRTGQTELRLMATATMTDSEEQRFELRIIVADGGQRHTSAPN